MPKTLGIWEWGCPKRGDAQNAVTPAHGVGVSMEDPRTEVWTLNLTGVAWVDFYK